MSISPQNEDELLRERHVVVTGRIDDANAKQVIAKLLYLQYLDQHSPVTLVINSPGGSVASSFAILETMNDLSPPVHATCTGQAFGIAANLLAHGAKGARSATPLSRIQLAPIWSAPMDEKEIEEIGVQIEKDRLEIIRYLAKDTGRTADEIAINMERSTVFSPQQAIEFGFIDRVL